MPFSKFIVIPIFIALQAASMMLISKFIAIGPESIGGPALINWIAFQAWAMYFMGGCTLKMGAKIVIGYAGGIIGSVAIFTLIGVFAGPLGTYWGPALAVFIVVIPIICAERIPGLDFVPAWFVGAGAFFALQFISGAATMAEYISIAIPEMIACIIGLFYGFITVAFRNYYEPKVTAETIE